jgi:hypothetical protein
LMFICTFIVPNICLKNAGLSYCIKNQSVYKINKAKHPVMLLFTGCFILHLIFFSVHTPDGVLVGNCGRAC